MTNLVIGVFSDDSEACKAGCKALAKETNRDDLGFYHTVFQGRHVTVVEPAAFPQKIQPLVYSAVLADYCVVLITKPSAFLGEIIVLLDLLGKRNGVIVSELDVSAFVKGTVLEGFPVVSSLDEAKHAAFAFQPVASPGGLAAWVDHSFDVKGVGSVALGVVRQGGFKKHDKLFAFPGKKVVEVKSIQENDVDVLEAKQGDRFGICFKGAGVDDVARGALLAFDASEVKDFTVNVQSTRFLRQAVPKKTLHLVNGLQCVPAKIDAEITSNAFISANTCLEKPIAFEKGDAGILIDLDAKSLRVVGKVVF